MKRFLSVACACLFGMCLLLYGRRCWRTSPDATFFKFIGYDICHGHDVWCKTFWPQVIDPDFKIGCVGTCSLNTFVPYLPNDYQIFFIADTKDAPSIRNEINAILRDSKGVIKLSVQQGWKTLVPKTEIQLSSLKLAGNLSYYWMDLAKVPMKDAVVEMPITIKAEVKCAELRLQKLFGQVALMVKVDFSI